jgi:hypothetical protein
MFYCLGKGPIGYLNSEVFVDENVSADLLRNTRNYLYPLVYLRGQGTLVAIDCNWQGLSSAKCNIISKL